MSHPLSMSLEDAISGTESHGTSLNIRKGKEPESSMFSKPRASPLLGDEEGIVSTETDVTHPTTNIQVSAEIACSSRPSLICPLQCGNHSYKFVGIKGTIDPATKKELEDLIRFLQAMPSWTEESEENSPGSACSDDDNDDLASDSARVSSGIACAALSG